MITLGTARLHADDAAYEVSVAITWEFSHAWIGILGGQLPWRELVDQSLELEVPKALAPHEEAVITDVIIDAVLDNENEVRARGVIIRRGAFARHLRWNQSAAPA